MTLGLLAFVSPRVDRLLTSPRTPNAIPHSVPDARLVLRPNPTYPGHDRKGFRNLKVPAKTHIVALGDSQTYGHGVEPEDAWPRQLESMTGKKVYSMAWGGYGPTHSLVMWDEAIALSPKIVIEAFYAGNDLFDSFNHVYNQGQLPELKIPIPSCKRVYEKQSSPSPLPNVYHECSRWKRHLLPSTRRQGLSLVTVSLPEDYFRNTRRSTAFYEGLDTRVGAWLISPTTLLKKNGKWQRHLRKRIQHTARCLATGSSKPFLQASIVSQRLILEIPELQKGFRFH